MPSANILKEKEAVVASLVERLQAAESGLLVDYKGINVADDTALRRELRESGVEYSVVKNTLTRLAIDKVGYSELDQYLNGTTSLATSGTDAIAPFRIVSSYAKKLANCFTVKAAFLDGKILSESEIDEMSALSSKDELYSKVLGTMLAPITSLAVVLGQVLEQMGAPAPAAEEAAAPAAE